MNPSGSAPGYGRSSWCKDNQRWLAARTQPTDVHRKAHTHTHTLKNTEHWTLLTHRVGTHHSAGTPVLSLPLVLSSGYELIGMELQRGEMSNTSYIWVELTSSYTMQCHSFCNSTLAVPVWLAHSILRTLSYIVLLSLSSICVFIWLHS